MAARFDAFKVTPPNPRGAVDRLKVIDWIRSIVIPAKWLCGPSGSGKSIAAAQYAKATRKRICWYRLDARDDDPAFFYVRWGNAAKVGLVGKRRRPLPRVTAEDAADEAAFARRFFTAAAAPGSTPTIFVFDDAHLLTSHSRLQALAHFVSSIDDTHEVLFIGQETAPREFFDVIAAQKIALCNDVPLGFDAEECAALAHRLRLAGRTGTELARITGGHAGTLVLACELLRTTHARGSDSSLVAQIHEHLLERLLERISPARRELLLQTSFAPQFSVALAAALGGEEAAGELEGMVRQGLLSRHASSTGETYEAHALIRQGAQTAIRERDGEASALKLALKTADLLEAHGQPDQAFDLLIEHRAQERAAEVLEALAPQYARSGEASRASRAANLLGAQTLHRHPWLCFWVGRALQGADEEQARGWFERSYAGFAASQDVAGMRIAAASVVIAFIIEYGDIRTLDTWLRRHVDAGGELPIEHGCAHEATLCMAVTCAALNAGSYPATVDSSALVYRLQVLLDDASAWLTRDHAVEAARLLVDHARVFGNREQAQNMVLAMRRHIDDANAGALQRGRWYLSAADAYLADGKRDTAERYMRDARTLAEQSGSRRLAFDIAQHDVNAAQSKGDLKVAMDHLANLESLVVNGTPAQRAGYARLTARLRLAQHDYVEGLRWAEQALDLAKQAGYEGASARVFELERIFGLAANGRFGEASQHAREMASRLQGAQFVFADSIAHCLDFLADDKCDPESLRRGLHQAESAGYVYMLARAGKTLPTLCDSALRHQIHVEFVHRLIATNKLLPPAGTGAYWPWPVRIRTLGGFDLEIASETYKPSRKAQDKPLELLKLLVCCQAMRRDSADKQWIAQRLWPEADDANARKSLDMTISRLRRLLRDEDAIIGQESRLGLSPTRVWSDVAFLLEAHARVGTLRDRAAAGHALDRAVAAADVAAVLEHFRGPFLPEDEGPPWLLAGREAVASTVRATLFSVESLLEDGEDPNLLRALERAFNADTTSEDLARALIRALIRDGQQAEALRVYRRLREMLSVVLGVVPSSETEQLRQRIHAEADAGTASATSASR